jgi:hypothetical protein
LGVDGWGFRVRGEGSGLRVEGRRGAGPLPAVGGFSSQHTLLLNNPFSFHSLLTNATTKMLLPVSSQHVYSQMPAT